MPRRRCLRTQFVDRPNLRFIGQRCVDQARIAPFT
jgi:hypothetical protein